MCRILVVDDQPIARRGIRLVLSQYFQPWQISEARNGLEAMAQIERLHPTVVLLDVVMPEMGGAATAYEIRRRYPDTKIVFLSTYYEREEAAPLTQLLGAEAFVPKSAAATDLLPIVRRLLKA